MTPEVSVLVATLDGREMVEECLAALDAQTMPARARETIVFDNGSRDGTADALRGRDGVTVLAHHENLGFAEANNRAAAAARAPWLVLLNNDAHPEPPFLESMLDAARRHDADAVGGQLLDATATEVEFGGAGLSWIGFGFQRSSWHPGFSARADGAPMPFACGGAMAVRRDAFLQAGGFDADYFAYYEDVDLGWRLSLAGRRIVFAPAARVRHRRHATASRFSDAWRHRHWYKNILQTALKDAEDVGATAPATLAVLQARIASFHRECAAARERGDAEAARRWLEIAAGASEGVVWTLEHLDRVLAKRRAVQATRTVSDRELHARFGFAADLGAEADGWPEAGLSRRLAALFAPTLFHGEAAPAPHDDGATVAALRHELSSLRGSWSWRLTAPVRAALDALRGRG